VFLPKLAAGEILESLPKLAAGEILESRHGVQQRDFRYPDAQIFVRYQVSEKHKHKGVTEICDLLLDDTCEIDITVSKPFPLCVRDTQASQLSFVTMPFGVFWDQVLDFRDEQLLPKAILQKMGYARFVTPFSTKFARDFAVTPGQHDFTMRKKAQFVANRTH
jgi:hypothetical protein